jgi:hypothetical protein
MISQIRLPLVGVVSDAATAYRLGMQLVKFDYPAVGLVTAGKAISFTNTGVVVWRWLRAGEPVLKEAGKWRRTRNGPFWPEVVSGACRI